MARAHNFQAGPAALPFPVVEKANSELLDYAGSGMSIMEMSHRGKHFDDVIEAARANLRSLLSIPEDYSVLFLQGGASLQFAMIPLNLLGKGQTADYVHTGSWAAKAIKEAGMVGNVNLAWDGRAESCMRMPEESELKLTDGGAYVHITSNETIGGVQYKSFPDTDAPLVADMSSDILSKPLDVSKFGLIYAGAQKNLGPSGVTLVIIRKDLAERAPAELSTMLQYRTHVAKESLYNTPNTWGIYLLKLGTEWVRQAGGVEKLQEINGKKAALLYGMLDSSDFWKPCARRESRSEMNVTWRTADESAEPLFIKEATEARLIGLKGHRSVGGLRASIYNAVPMESVQALVEFMKEFERKHG